MNAAGRGGGRVNSTSSSCSLCDGAISTRQNARVELLSTSREQENRLWALYTIAGLAQAALARGDLERAGTLWGAAEKEGDRLPSWGDERTRRAGLLVAEDRPEFTIGYSTGRELDLWDAAAIALK